jgi:hypothetical protein
MVDNYRTGMEMKINIDQACICKHHEYMLPNLLLPFTRECFSSECVGNVHNDSKDITSTGYCNVCQDIIEDITKKN